MPKMNTKKAANLFRLTALCAAVMDGGCSVFHFKDSGDQYRFDLTFHVLIHLVMRLPRIVINPPQAELIHVAVIVPENAVYGVRFPGSGFLDHGQREQPIFRCYHGVLLPPVKLSAVVSLPLVL